MIFAFENTVFLVSLPMAFCQSRVRPTWAKAFAGARIISELVCRGKSAEITANKPSVHPQRDQRDY